MGRRRLTLAGAGALAGLLLAALAWWAVPRPAPSGTLLVELSGRSASSLPSTRVEIHAAAGWRTLGTFKGGPVPAAPATARATLATLKAGRYDAIRLAGSVLSRPLSIDSTRVEPALVAVEDGRPVELYAGNEDFNLGLAELSGKLAPLPDFSLQDQAGGTVSRADLLGHPAVIAAFHTTCRETCPLYTGLFLQLSRQLPASVRLLEVSTDPDHDSVNALASYAAAIGAGWTFLTGDRVHLDQFWTPLGVRLSGDDAHSNFLAVVDEHGFLHTTLSGVPSIGGTLPVPLASNLSDAGRSELVSGGSWGSGDVLDAVRELESGLAKAPVAGSAPDFVAPLLAGGTFALAETRDRPVLLNFWASYCAPCRREMPLLARSARERGLLLVLVDERDDAGAARAFLKQVGVSGTVVSDADGRVGDLYGVQYYPVTIYIRPGGSLGWRHVGETDASILSAYLGQG